MKSTSRTKNIGVGKSSNRPIYIEQIDHNLVLMNGYTKDGIDVLRNLESNITTLIKEYGARECSYCGGIKIDCFPFFSQSQIDKCSDCEEIMTFKSEVLQ
ncbi:hypothetical protein AB4Z45_03420 [Paenibacillus sp. MCAF9]|uniref:hypothetical protein n=1 Tax=Paenibacillus sp. MCAF9 TaxID=3233046 RepID=UPI003F9BDDD5